MIRPAADNECFPWFCRRCQSSGVLISDQPVGPGEISEVMLKAHREASEECGGSPLFVAASRWQLLCGAR